MPEISMCMIVRNEEKFLPKCLESVKGLVDEIIIVDTGSTDRTIEIAKKAGAKIINYEWNDDTAAARNTGLKEAKGDWILVLDADEIIGKESFEPIRKLTEKEFDAYYLVQLNYTNSAKDINFIPLQKKTPYSMDFHGFFPIEIIRFFRNSKGIEFTSIVHERLNDSIKKLGLKSARTDIPIHHYQFLKGEDEMKRKQLAFLRLFEKKVKEFPDDAKMRHDMGVIYYNYEHDEKKAIECFEKAIKLSPKYLAPMFSLATIYTRKKDIKKAIEYYQKVISINPKHAATHYNLGNLFAMGKMYDWAIAHYTEAVKQRPIPGAFNNAGNIFVVLGRWEAALEAYRLAIKYGHPRKEQLQKKVEEIESLINKYQTNNSMIKEILETNWDNYKTDLFPKNRRMKVLEDKKVDGMSTENIRFMINEIVRKFSPNGVYLEAGTYRGCSLLSAALFNPSTRCIGIDDFSQFDGISVKDFKKDGLNNKETLKNNLLSFGNPKNVEFYNMDYKECIKKIFSKEPDLRVNVYYYDGEHSYENQSEGLRIMIPYLAEKCIILVDDINWEGPETATEDFIKENPDFKSLFKIKTTAKKGIGTKDWWNGFQLVARGI